MSDDAMAQSDRNKTRKTPRVRSQRATCQVVVELLMKSVQMLRNISSEVARLDSASRYCGRCLGVLSCYDRILITGTLPGACFAGGMTHILYSKGVRIFGYAQFTAPLRDRVREQAAVIAREAGITIEHIAKRHIRKEEVVAKILAKRGDHIIPAWCM